MFDINWKVGHAAGMCVPVESGPCSWYVCACGKWAMQLVC